MKLISSIRQNIHTELELEYSLRKYDRLHTRVDCIPEINDNDRVNLIVPSLEGIFGGISTAFAITRDICKMLSCEVRVISLGINNIDAVRDYFSGIQNCSIVVVNNGKASIRPKDVFVCTFWSTALVAKQCIGFQKLKYGKNKKLIYLIQDFEPGFYRWTSEYAEAERSYSDGQNIIAIINSKELYDFMNRKNYGFYATYYFEPRLNEKLRLFLESHSNTYQRKNQIIFYGRPSIHRNAFSLVVNSLKIFARKAGKTVAHDWKIYSIGEKHRNIKLSYGLKIESLGKLTLEEYGRIMLESKIGISLMISPHPSYPPLEMSTFGVRTITNCFENKNLSDFNDNLICLHDYSAENISETLMACLNENKMSEPNISGPYCETTDYSEIALWLKETYFDLLQ